MGGKSHARKYLNRRNQAKAQQIFINIADKHMQKDNISTVSSSDFMTVFEDYYHIGICGQVSTGKSTCLNALMGNYLSQISLKRSTKKVLKFYHTPGDEKNHKPTCIKKIIEEINNGPE